MHWRWRRRRRRWQRCSPSKLFSRCFPISSDGSLMVSAPTKTKTMTQKWIDFRLEPRRNRLSERGTRRFKKHQPPILLSIPYSLSLSLSLFLSLSSLLIYFQATSREKERAVSLFPSFWVFTISLWSRTSKNRDVSTGPLAHPFANLLMQLIHLRRHAH